MATIGNISGSQFIGCPITVPVTCASISADATFRRVRLKVEVSQDGTKVDESEFSTPVSAGKNQTETVEFDVSSALRAVAEQYQYDVDPAQPAVVRPMNPGDPTPDTGGLTYPAYTIVLKAYDDYMVDGQEQEGMDAHTSTISDAFYQGKLTDRERLSDARPSRYSRKPTSSNEIVFIGSEHITPGPTSAAPYAHRDVVTADSSLAYVYPVAMPVDGYQLRFVNSLGILESLCISCLRDEETPIEQNEYVVAKQETLTDFSHGVTDKANDQEVWKMSSGPLDRAWQSYYIHEVLMAKKAWLKVNDLWLPVHIKPEDSTPGVNRTKASMLEVQFKLKFDITGSPL